MKQKTTDPRSNKLTGLLVGTNLIFLLLVLLTVNLLSTEAASLVDSLKGRILLQVEQHGEAWYVNPTDNKRYYLGRPDDAFEIMRSFGLGITNNDLDQIPVGNINKQVCCESYGLGSYR